MTGENIAANILEERKRGDDCLAAAAVLIENEFHNDAISRCYYGALHYVRALLLTKGIEPKSHHGALQLLGLNFIKDGPLDSSVSGDFAQLASFREISDYNSSTSFTEAQARAELERANRIVKAITSLLPARS